MNIKVKLSEQFSEVHRVWLGMDVLGTGSMLESVLNSVYLS